MEEPGRAGVAANRNIDLVYLTSDNPPTATNIQRGKADAARRNLEKELLFFDYGDEIAFSEARHDGRRDGGPVQGGQPEGDGAASDRGAAGRLAGGQTAKQPPERLLAPPPAPP